MIKKLAVSICLLFSLGMLAQEGTSSPYSFYGIGEVRFKGTIETRSMGGLTIFPDSIHMNLQNPAHYSSLKLTTLSLGGTYAMTNMETESSTGKARRTTLDYLAVGLPMGKLGVGFGIAPYSSVGYKVKSAIDIDGLPGTKRFAGTGGVNKVFVGFGYKISKNFSAGAGVDYNFGRVETASRLFPDGVQLGTRELNNSDINGASFNFGLTYKGKINKKYDFYSAVSYTPEATLSSENERKLATIQLYSSGAEQVMDEETIDVADTEIKLPSKISFGSGIGEMKKWMVGAEITLQQGKDVGNRFEDIDGVEFENTIKYTIGGYYIPKYNSFSSYFSRITYRAGFRYENTGLVIRDKSITDTGITAGLGLPLGGTFSNINIGLEYGKRGTIYSGLVQENYVNLSIGLSLNDKWFVKRKYD